MKNLKARIIADGKVDSSEVAELTAIIYSDGKVDAEEIRTLFEINDATSNNDSIFTDLVVTAVKDWALADDKIIDEEESELLVELIGESTDTTEKAVLLMIAKESVEVKNTALTLLIVNALS